ncbi:MAG: ATP phosphoribosyltransferase [Anaerolineales bacterium]|nr:ATP phosphoribosyltransferase [Anaerolineales bacterium]
MTRTDIRFGLPSKGILEKGAVDFLRNCGMNIFRPNPRQYAASIPNLPGVSVLFQRPGDIVVGIREGSVDFGITGYDILAEKAYANPDILILHDALGFGPCTLDLAVPEELPIRSMADVYAWAETLAHDSKKLRIATKFPNLTRDTLEKHAITNYKLIGAEGTLEIAPAIGYADMIADLVSSGITLRDNHLRLVKDGQILRSEAVLAANKIALKTRPEVLHVAQKLLEYTEAYLRAQGSYSITVNMRGNSPETIAQKVFAQTSIGGLQGPTIAPVVARENLRNGTNWYAINIIVQKDQLFEAVAELRSIGGSGVIVTPCAYIFEEEPARYRAMLEALADDNS